MTATATLTATDAQAVFDSHAAAWNRADATALAASYAAEGRLVVPFGDTMTGRDAIEAGFEENFAGILNGSTTTIEVHDVRDLGHGLAVVEATQVVTGPLPPLHVTAVMTLEGERAALLEVRVYAFLPDPR